MQLVTVAVLFAREDSHYKTLPQCDVYDMARDARTYDGPHPVAAHLVDQGVGVVGAPGLGGDHAGGLGG